MRLITRANVPLPLLAPWTARTEMAMARLVDMPQTMKQVMVHSRPTIRLGFRPHRSATLPQGTAARLWKTEKTADVMPAHLATSFSDTPKSRTICGR